MGAFSQSLSLEDDMLSIYEESCKSAPSGRVVICQNVHKLAKSDSLFYTDVVVKNQVSLHALIDSGSMACTMSEEAEQKLRSAGLCSQGSEMNTDIVLVGCGGMQVTPKCVFQLEMSVYGQEVSVPTLIVPGQHDQLILGSNVIKHLICQLKQTLSYWRVMNKPESTDDSEVEHFLNMLSGVNRWKGKVIPDIIGTAKLTQAVTLLPRHEHLVWARLPVSAPVSEGSAVLVDAPRSQSHKKNIMVGRAVATMSGDRWVPVKIINPSDKPVTLRRNAKVADVFPCVALEDLEMSGVHTPRTNLQVHSQDIRVADTGSLLPPPSVSQFSDALQKIGLGDIDIDSCDVSPHWKEQLFNLLQKYEGVFSRGKLDCGEAPGFVHRIHLTDTRPFRLPYRRVPPGHYLKLRQVLSEMEEK